MTQIAAANIVPPMLAPHHDQQKSGMPMHMHVVTITEDKDQPIQQPWVACLRKQSKLVMRLEKLFNKLYLSGTDKWEGEDQQEARGLTAEYVHLFAPDNLNLGRMSPVKHKIKLPNNTPFKERYRRIPPQQFDEVKDHLQEMLDLGAIQHSNSPWASTVILVWKKDGSLRFCIVLCKLNSHMVKDAYSLPRIDETLDCLNGTRIFPSLDLKSRYWPVELEEERDPNHLYHWPDRVLWVQENAIWSNQCACDIPKVDGNLSWGASSQLVYHIPRQYHNILKNTKRTYPALERSIPEIGWGWIEIKAIKIWLLSEMHYISGTCSLS